MKWLQSVAAEFTGYRRKATIGLVVVMLVMGAASVAVGQFEQRFSDVPVDDPNRTAIEWAADAGLTIGYGDGTFGPDDPMNQFEALLFMERFFDLGLAEGFTRGDMMGLMHAINQDFPLLNRTNCYRSASTASTASFVLLEGHHGVEFWITEPDGSKYKGTLAVDIVGRDVSRLFPTESFSDNQLSERTGEWFTTHRARVSEVATIEVFTNEPAKWTVCITARRLEKIGL